MIKMITALSPVCYEDRRRNPPVDQIAQMMRTGWKNNLMSRAWSVSNPKASVLLTYCAMFPGKINT